MSGPPPVLTIHHTDQQLPDCTSTMSVCPCVPMCERILTCSGISEEMFWKQEAEQLKLAQDCLKENVCEKAH